MKIKKDVKNSRLISSAYYFAESARLRRALNSKRLSAKVLAEFSHRELYHAKVCGVDKFNHFADKAHGAALKSIAAKPKIKIGFVAYSSSMWSCDKLYRLFEADGRFEPFIILCTLGEQVADKENSVYSNALNFFSEKGYKLITAAENPNGSLRDFGNPDILIYLTPYSTSLSPKCFSVGQIPLDRLVVYIPYSFIVSGNEELLKNGTLNLAWKFFCESRHYLELMKTKSLFGGKNTVFTGFPGMDTLLDGRDDKGLFKGEKSLKKTIYAPHFSVGESGIGFSTFKENHRFMLELATKTSGSVSWVIKPHPRLKSESVRCNIFKSEEEFNEYIAKWDALPNARSMFGGGYNDLFAESDAIILDSASFLAEYQFTGNPLLFLTNSRQRFNAFGESILKTVYKADGNDFAAIESFVYDTVISGQDDMQPLRKAFFERELNYIKNNGNMTASEKIYSIIRSEIENGN